MKKLLLKYFIWKLWKNLHSGLKHVLGHKTLSASIQEMKEVENVIRLENKFSMTDAITWDNSKNTDCKTVARYFTLKHFNDIGELLAFFRAIILKKIEGANNGK